MIILQQGYVLYVIGGAMILFSLSLLFPKQFTKKEDLPKIDPQRLKSNPWGYLIIAVGIGLIVLGYIFKI